MCNPEAIAECESALASNNLSNNIMVDCSHANSNKDHRLQMNVGKSVGEQIIAGNQSITGLMFESNSGEGRQDQPAAWVERYVVGQLEPR